MFPKFFSGGFPLTESRGIRIFPGMEKKFATYEFRVMLMKAFTEAASARSLQGYHSPIVDKLQEIAVEVASKFSGDIEASAEVEPIESRSATTIAQTAAAIAQNNGRQYITWADVEYAIEMKFCTVHPFCKPER